MVTGTRDRTGSELCSYRNQRPNFNVIIFGCVTLHKHSTSVVFLTQGDSDGVFVLFGLIHRMGLRVEGMPFRMLNTHNRHLI